MQAYLQTIARQIDAWGLTETCAIGIGLLTLIVVFSMPLRDVDHLDDYAGLTYGIAIVAIGVTSVVALPGIWRSSMGVIYSLCFCVVVGGLSILRFRLGGNEVKVVAKAAKESNPEKAKNA